MAAEKQVKPWKTISISPSSYEMLETALLQLADKEPKWEKQIRHFGDVAPMPRVVEHIDAMRNARRNSQLEMPV